MSDDYRLYDLDEDGSYYDDDYDELDYDDYVPYHERDTFLNFIKRWLRRLRWRLYSWRHKDDPSDIPF